MKHHNGTQRLQRPVKQRTLRIIPGFRLTLSVTLLMLCVLILIPLSSILAKCLSLSPERWKEILTAVNVRNAFGTSISCALEAALINSITGILLAWVLVRYDFPLRRLLDGLIELPFAMPTAVAGITLSRMYSTSGFAGKLLEKLGIRVSYTRSGIVLALVFVGIPFVVRTVQPVLEKLDPQCEEAALVLGSSRFRTFLKVILPELLPAVLTGFSLAFARGIGEYGSVIYISGNSAKEKTQVISYVIMQKLNYLDYDEAAGIALVLLGISFLILFLIGILKLFQEKRARGSEGAREARSARTKAAPGQGAGLTAAAAVFIVLMLVVPLFYVLSGALRQGAAFYMTSLSTPEVRSALRVTLIATASAVAVNTFFGLFASWVLTRFSFRGRQLLAVLIDIPFSVSPVIAGLAYIMMFGRTGWAAPIVDAVGNFLGRDIQIVFALPGVVLATVFVTFPFVCREVIPVLEASGREEEEAAAMMGAKGGTIFRRITLPHIRGALIYGIILCAARAMGEFGAVNALSRTRGETFTLPQEIDALYLSGTADSITGAFAVSSILVILAILILIARTILDHRRKAKG